MIENILHTARGDSDLNNSINFVDFVMLSNSFGAISLGWQQGNYNVDNVINFDDFSEVANHFGNTYPTADVPQPSSALMAIPLAMFLLQLSKTARTDFKP